MGGMKMKRLNSSGSKNAARGFTLIELMVVVAIIGVLAALAIAGISKYITNAKAAEARSNVGSMAKLAIVAIHTPKAIAIGTDENLGTVAANAPAAAVAGGQGCVYPDDVYTPPIARVANGAKAYGDWSVQPWTCLKFGLDRATPFGYRYNKAPDTTVFAAMAAPDPASGLPSFRVRGAYNAALHDWIVGELAEDPAGAPPNP